MILLYYVTQKERPNYIPQQKGKLFFYDLEHIYIRVFGKPLIVFFLFWELIYKLNPFASKK